MFMLFFVASLNPNWFMFMKIRPIKWKVNLPKKDIKMGSIGLHIVFENSVPYFQVLFYRNPDHPGLRVSQTLVCLVQIHWNLGKNNFAKSAVLEPTFLGRRSRLGSPWFVTKHRYWSLLEEIVCGDVLYENKRNADVCFLAIFYGDPEKSPAGWDVFSNFWWFSVRNLQKMAHQQWPNNSG